MPLEDILERQVNYVRGLNIANDATSPDTIVVMGAGACLDSTGTNDIVLASAVNINAALVGAGGVDAGTFDTDTYLAASETYGVYILGDSTKYNDPVGMLSAYNAANDEPLMPVGYDMYRRVGWVFTDATKDIKAFKQYGSAEVKEYLWRVPEVAFTGNAPIANASLLLNSNAVAAELLMAPIAGKARLDVDYTPALATSLIDMQPYDATPDADGQVAWLPGIAAQTQQPMEVFTAVQTNEASIVWKATAADPVDIKVIGWVEYLA